MRFKFFLEEAYDGMTVPKNLIREEKMQMIITKLAHGRDRIINQLLGGIPHELVPGDDVEAGADQHYGYWE